MSTSSLASILIWLPIAGALLIWLLPLSRYATGSLALLFSLAEVGFWIEQAARFDFARSGLQMEERASWFGDLGVLLHGGAEQGGLGRVEHGSDDDEAVGGELGLLGGGKNGGHGASSWGGSSQATP